VLKHAVLHAVLEAEAETNRSLLYVETHAARGFYDLTSEQSVKTNEAESGVLALPKANKAASALQPWLRHVQSKGPTSYPGSPGLASQILGPNARLALFELHPAEHKALSQALHKDSRVQIRKEDGYRGALRLQPRRGEEMLVVLDPSYETDADMDALANWVRPEMAESPFPDLASFVRRWPRRRVWRVSIGARRGVCRRKPLGAAQ